MSYKAITIYTPEGSAPHISAADDAFIHDSLAGASSGVLGGLVCKKVDDTTVRLSGGGVSNRGYVMYIPSGTSHDLTVEAGTQSLRRHDLVVAQFTKGGGDTADAHIFRIVKGTASVAPSDPSLLTSYLIESGNVNQIALFRIIINGLAIESVELVAPSLAAGEYIKCCGAVGEIVPNSGEITRIKLTAAGGVAKGRCLSVSNGAIICGVDGIVEVAGSVYMQGTANPEKYHACYVMKNDTELTPGIRPAVLYGAVSTPSQFVQVSAGDTLTLHCRTDAADGKCIGTNSATWLSVKYI